MAIWKEEREGPSVSNRKGIYRAILKKTSNPTDAVKISYLRYLLGAPVPLMWRVTPDNAVNVIVPGAGVAQTMEEGKALAMDILDKLDAGDLVADETPYVVPPVSEKIAELEHPSKLLTAWILKWPEFYEVRTIGYVPNGFTLPVQTPAISTDPDYEWGRLDIFERLLADTREEAEQLAKEELERLASSEIPVQSRTSS